MIAAQMLVPESVVRILSIDDCRPEIRELHAIWQEMRGRRRMPVRRAFNPAKAKRLLPHLMLVDVLPDAPRERRFRVRLHGTAQVDYQGVNWTGAFPHEKTDRPSADRLCAAGDHVVASRLPLMSTGSLYWLPERPYSAFQAILLPLSEDDERVNMILGLTLFY